MNFTGEMNCASTDQLHFPKIKTLSKQLGVTINDIISCAITTSLGTLFKEKGDKNTDIQLMIPANIRFQFYPSRNDIKLENKFSSIPVILPLTDSMQSAYSQVAPIMKNIKSKFLMIYASYAFTYIANLGLPKTIPRRILDIATKKITLAFSNVPGPIKPLFYKQKNGLIIKSVWQQGYFIIAGYGGLSICCISFCDSFKITITCDNGILNEEETKKLARYIGDNVKNEI